MSHAPSAMRFRGTTFLPLMHPVAVTSTCSHTRVSTCAQYDHLCRAQSLSRRIKASMSSGISSGTLRRINRSNNTPSAVIQITHIATLADCFTAPNCVSTICKTHCHTCTYITDTMYISEIVHHTLCCEIQRSVPWRHCQQFSPPAPPN